MLIKKKSFVFIQILTEVLTQFIDMDAVKGVYKGHLVGTVLSGYLALRKLVVQLSS